MVSNTFEINALLRRIGVSEILAVDSQSLKKLHAACVTNIPFETLDIFFGKKFSLSFDELYDKIVVKKRGGYCYELNGFLFYVLKILGFDVSIHNAKLYNDQNEIIPASQHMTLVVKLEDSWLVDIGYGNGFLEPLSLESSQIQRQGSRSFRCTQQDSYYLVEEMNGSMGMPLYALIKEPKQVADFEARNCFHQTSKESVFSGKRICMIMRENVAVELNGNELTRRASLGTTCAWIAEEQIPHVLQTEFGIECVYIETT